MSILCISGNTLSIQACMKATLHCCLLIIHRYLQKDPSCLPPTALVLVYLHCIYSHQPLSLFLPVLVSVITPHPSLYGYTNTGPFGATAFDVLTISCLWLIISFLKTLFIPTIRKDIFFLNYLLQKNHSVIGSNN